MPRNATSLGRCLLRRPSTTPVFTATRAARGWSSAPPKHSTTLARHAGPATIQRKTVFISPGAALQCRLGSLARIFSAERGRPPQSVVGGFLPDLLDLGRIFENYSHPVDDRLPI